MGVAIEVARDRAEQFGYETETYGKYILALFRRDDPYRVGLWYPGPEREDCAWVDVRTKTITPVEDLNHLNLLLETYRDLV